MIHISECVLGSTGHNSGETEDTVTELWKLAVQEPSLRVGLGFLVVVFFSPEVSYKTDLSRKNKIIHATVSTESQWAFSYPRTRS